MLNNFGTSVIVCTLNNEKDIGEMLDTIHKQVDQIIIADGNSNDNTIEIAKKYDNVEISITEAGFSRQINKALKHVNFKYLLMLESDHRYPSNFVKEFIEEFEKHDYFVMQATLICDVKNSFFEKGIDLFYQIHQLKKGAKDTTGGPAIYYSQNYIDYCSMDSFNGYSIDTQRAEIWKLKGFKAGLGKTMAYQHQELDCRTFFRKYFNYGKGDYDFYNSHKHDWALKRKIQSIFHIFNRYIVDYPIKSFKVGKPHIAIPYLWLSAMVRYSGWVYSIFKNSSVSK